MQYQSRRVGFEQLDDGTGCIFGRAVLKKLVRSDPTPRSKRGQDPKEIISLEVLRISALLIARRTRERIASRAEPRKFRTSSGLSFAKLTAVVEPVEGDFSVLADLDEVAVGIACSSAIPSRDCLMAR
jgi:hypothetical protein